MTQGAQRRLLVVEDEETIRQTLRYALRREGYDVIEAADGVQALEQARSKQPDLILLDLLLPGLGGMDVCRILRQEMRTPILMLTAKATEGDTISGLQGGADDYMTKPFSLPELVARIAALLRRSDLTQAEDASPEVVEYGGFRLDRAARQVTVDGEEVRLAPREFDLLAHLVQHPGRVQSRDALIRQVWGSRFFGENKTVDVHVRWLREKFERFERLPFRITTVFGVGYRLDQLDAE